MRYALSALALMLLIVACDAGECGIVVRQPVAKHCPPAYVPPVPVAAVPLIPVYQEHYFTGYPVISFQFYSPQITIGATGFPGGAAQPPQSSGYAQGPAAGVLPSGGSDFPVAQFPQGGQVQASASGGGHVQVLKQHCASCHSGAGKGGVTIFDGSGNYAPNVKLGRLYEAMDPEMKPRSQMPPSGAIPGQQLIQIRKQLAKELQ